MRDRVETAIPGRAPIELTSFYEEFRDYYPQCEMETKSWFVENVRPDWWIFDIGANIGYYSILFAQLAPNGRVLAFEPTSTAKMLRENLQHNNMSNVEVHELALGAVTGLHQDRIYRVWGTEGEVQAYPFYKLDDFIDERKPARVDCIKIDVDSFDFEVLRGAERTLREWNPFIVVELNHALSKRNQSAGEALAWLAQRGYRRAHVVDHDNFVLRRVEASGNVDIAGTNTLELVFSPPMRFNESLDTIEGQRVAKLLLNMGRLQNDAELLSVAKPGETDAKPFDKRAPSLTGALLDILPFTRKFIGRQEPDQGPPDGGVPLTTIIGNDIKTSAAIWSYALVLEFDVNALRSLPSQSLLSVEVAIEVVEGKLGVVLAGSDQSEFSSPERTLSAMPGAQRIIVAAPVDGVRHLIFRNVAFEGTRTVFRLTAIDAKSTQAP